MAEVWLVTGAAGFIGSTVVEDLLAKGHTVIGVDNLYSGYRENVTGFSHSPNWHWFNMDIRDKALADLFEQFNFTHVLHLAAIVSVPECEQHPELARAVNETAFDRLLQLSLAHGIKQFIYASSSAVYGACELSVIPESAPLKPISLYGETKVANERTAQALAAESTMLCTGLRFFNLFGKRQRVGSGYAAVIPKWLAAIKANQSPVVFGDGLSTRDFCDIANVLQAIDCIRRSTLSGHHVFNIGSGQAVSLLELYALLTDIIGHHPALIHEPPRAGDIVHSCADISHARQLLGYEPVVSLADGLRVLA